MVDYSQSASVQPLVVVWVMDPDTLGRYVWNNQKWRIENRLIPMESEDTDGSNGRASFRLLRNTRNDGYFNDWAVTQGSDQNYYPQRGQFVAICSYGKAPSQQVLWHGVITDIDLVPLAATADDVGSVTASGCGWALDQCPVRGLRALDTTAPDKTRILLTNPSANHQGLTQGVLIGNAVDNPNAASGNTDGSKASFKLWVSDPNNLTTDGSGLWSAYGLLDHILTYRVNTGLPALRLAFPDAAIKTYLDQPLKEVVRLDGMTLRSALDTLCGPARGLRWRIVPDYSQDGAWVVTIVSGTDIAVGPIPAAVPVNVSTDDTTVDMALAESQSDQYDAVEIEGNPVIWCGTCTARGGSWTAGWTAEAEKAYKKGPAGWASISPLDKQAATIDQFRSGGLLADVYQRFVLTPASGTASLRCRNVGDLRGSQDSQMLCPLLTWDGTTLTAAATDASPHLPSAHILSTIPWPIGVQGDGTDLRTPEQKARPRYGDPVLWMWEPGYALDDYVNLANPPYNYTGPTPSISSDDRCAALRISFTPPEMMARNHWIDASITAAPSRAFNADGTAFDIAARDFDDFAATIAIEGDQRVRVVRYRTGYDAATARGTMKVIRSDLHCWVVRAGTWLGVVSTSSTDTVTTDTFFRNDFPAAQRLADQMAASLFRRRTILRYVLAQPWAPPTWAVPGTMVGTVEEFARGNDGTLKGTGIKRTVLTCITSVRINYDPEHPRLTIHTGDIPGVSSTAIMPVSPTGTGPVSVALGGTLPSGVAQAQSDVAKVAKSDAVNRKIITAKPPSVTQAATTPWLSMLVRSGQIIISTPAIVYGIKRKAGEAKASDWKFANRNATATCALTSGAVTSITLTDCGVGYTSAPTVTVTPAPGGGTNAVVAASLATDGDRVEGVYITACGSGYTFANVTFTAAPGGGVTATGSAVLRDGNVVAVKVNNKGRGYTSVPACTITGDGTSATATAVRVPKAITLAITSAGSGYLVAPTITIAAPPVGVTPPPTPTDWDDGLGWGVISAGSLTGGITAGSAALICHDDRGMVAYGLMGDNGGSAPYSRAPDSVLSWYQTLVKLSTADANADGVLPAWVPMAGGV